MSVPPQENQIQQQTSDKELNFRRQEQMFKSQLEAERQEKAQMLAELNEMKSRAQSRHHEDDDDDSEPYVDQKKLKKTLNQFGEQTKQNTASLVQHEVQRALQEERRQNWLRNNPDFQEIMSHAQKFADADPELAETILQMPEGFDRQKLVYKNIKALGLHKPPEKAPSIQETIDKNRTNPYYQPSGVGTSPYASKGDYSESGQKNAYQKMLELKSRLRI